jgi:tRNA U34 2-thiouridine synthase MnmA/TrmU
VSAKAKGIGLLSGGLDSAVAAMVVREAGADVECLHFFTGFCVTGHNSRVGRENRPIANHALQVAAEAGIPVELVDASEDYLPVVLNPKHGYGRNMNPCIDCRVFMLERAKRHMENVGADFVFTGEVIGQRPKSQLKSALRAIEKECGLQDRLLRPLSARLLPPTRVEREGRIDRRKMLDIHGRGRKRQIALATKYGLSRFMQPAGGCCFLTDATYSRKLRDVIGHQGEDGLSTEDIFILGVGRHFRLSESLKVVIGRDEIENNFLENYAHDHWLARVSDFAGPTAVIMGAFTDDDLGSIGALVARYSDAKSEPTVEVEIGFGTQMKAVRVSPATDAFLSKYRV